MIYYFMTSDMWLRSLSAFLFCFLTFICVGGIFIQKLKTLQVNGQPIRDDGPKSHLLKAGTPTMGGLLIATLVTISFFIFMDISNQYLWIIYFVFLSFAILGFIDDYLKISQNNHKGLSIKSKLLVQCVVSIITLYLIDLTVSYELFYKIQIPYLDDVFIDIGILAYVFGFIVISGSSNAVNLTDGLDGLVTIPIIYCAAGFIFICYIVRDTDIAGSYSVFSIYNTEEIIVFLSSLIGACLGFLWFNSSPASLFMGDCGSLALGGSLGVISVILKHEILFSIMGGIFVIEAVSVLMQIYYFKFTNGKRIFLMSPVHHHYEKLGLQETKIVSRFHIISLVFLVIAMASFVI